MSLDRDQTDKQFGWQPIETYPIKDGRDAQGKWFAGPPGPLCDLLMEDGRIVMRAQWRGEQTRGGGVAYAFWTEDSVHGIGIYDPTHWRPAKAEAA